MRNVPRTIKNLLKSSSDDNHSKNNGLQTKASSRKLKTRPETLFESDRSYDEYDSFRNTRANDCITVPPTLNATKKYSTNVDLKEYNIPSRAERKRRYSSNSRKQNSKALGSPSPAPSQTRNIPTPKTTVNSPVTVASTGASTTSNTTATLNVDENLKRAESCLASIYGAGVGVIDPAFADAYAKGASMDKRTVRTPKAQVGAQRYFSSLDDIESMSGSDSEDAEEMELNPGYKEWKARRDAWTAPRTDYTPEPQCSVIKGMSESDKVLVYKHLVVNNRRVKKAIPLSDVINVLHAGWASAGI